MFIRKGGQYLTNDACTTPSEHACDYVTDYITSVSVVIPLLYTLVNVYVDLVVFTRIAGTS